MQWRQTEIVVLFLMDMNEMIKSMIFGEEAENLLNEKLNVEAMENPIILSFKCTKNEWCITVTAGRYS